jgi:hypothetical protein
MAADDEQVVPQQTVPLDAPLHPKSDIPRDDPDKDRDNSYAPEIIQTLGDDKVRELLENTEAN